MAATKVGVLGLGRMGLQMAKRLTGNYAVVGFDVSHGARGMGSEYFPVVGDMNEAVRDADFILSSLPFSSIVSETADKVKPDLKKGCVWVDATSGVPSVSAMIADKLKPSGVSFLDCGVAGGPAAAEKGTLSGMIGGPAGDVAKAMPMLELMMSTGVVHIGNVGAGHAVKAVNNALLATNIWTSYEAMVILNKLDVDLEKALDAINRSSGRSLVTEERIPRHVLTRKFDFGFSLGLMRKDVEICMRAINDLDIPSPVLRQIAAFWKIGEHSLGKEAEHMEVVKVLEQMSDARVEATSQAWPKLQAEPTLGDSIEELNASEEELTALLEQVRAKKESLKVAA